MKTDRDERLIQWVEYLINTVKAYNSETEYLRVLGFPPAKFSEVRKGKISFRADDIGIILKTSEQLDACWVMTGRGSMLREEGDLTQNSFFVEKYNQLEQENKDLIREVEKLKNELSNLKKMPAHIGMVAKDADADSYGLAK